MCNSTFDLVCASVKEAWMKFLMKIPTFTGYVIIVNYVKKSIPQQTPKLK